MTDEAIIPNMIEEVLLAVQAELKRAYVRWKLYKQLYGTNQERFDLMRATASSFFGHLQYVLIDDTMLAIARLTDPAESFGHANLSLAQLADRLVKGNQPPRLLKDLGSRLERINQLNDPFRNHRNKRIAHRDMPSRLNRVEELLPGISRRSIEVILGDIAGFVSVVDAYFGLVATGYDVVVTIKDGDSLIAALKMAAEYRNLLDEDFARYVHRLDNSKFKDA